jgi:hypothetical protein
MKDGQLTGVVTDDQIGVVALKVEEIDRGHGWARAIALGQLVLNELFGGSAADWMSRKPRDNSLRRLANHPKCPLRKSALAEALGVYIATIDDPTLKDNHQLTPSHVARVLQFEPSTRKRLLKEAEDNRLSVRAFGERVKQVRDGANARFARPASSSRKFVNRFEEGLSMIRGARLALADYVADLTLAQRRETETLLAGVEDEIALVRRALVATEVRSLSSRLRSTTRFEPVRAAGS